MIPVILLAFVLGLQQEAPYKPNDEFEIKFDLSFKQRLQGDHKPVHLNETRKEFERRTSTATLPFLNLKIKILKTQPQELKVKVVRDVKSLVMTKKVSEGMEFKLVPGFTDDIKDHIEGYRYVIDFLDSDRKTVSRILIEFDESGNYFVNGEKRGKI
jgi:hypothetical protein